MTDDLTDRAPKRLTVKQWRAAMARIPAIEHKEAERRYLERIFNVLADREQRCVCVLYARNIWLTS